MTGVNHQAVGAAYGETAVFPTVLGVNNNPNRTTTRASLTSVVLPSGSTAGDRTFIFFCAENSASITTPVGWNDIGVQVSFGGYRYKVFYADSVGAGPVNVSHGSARTSCVSLRLGNCHANAPETVTSVTGSSVNPNSPSVTGAGGALNYLALSLAAFGVASISTQSFTANPSGYNPEVTESGASGNSGTLLRVSSKQVSVATEDPGAYTISTSSNWVADTILVRGA